MKLRGEGRSAMRAAILTAIVLCSLGSAPAAAQEHERYDDPTEPIVITGIRVQDYRDRLAACLARNCPTDEDADATLALAEALFLEGEYGEARRAVAASLGRNRRRAGDYPEPVSDLYRAHARLSRHMGHDEAALRSAHGILEALREGIPVEDHRHFTARLEVSEAQMLQGRLNGALRELDRLAASARRAGRDDVVAMAELRALWYRHIANRHGPARSQLIEMSRSTDPERRIYALGAKVLLARIYRSEGNQARAAELLAEVGRGTTTRRRLLHSPAYQLQVHEAGTGDPEAPFSADSSSNTLSRLPDNYEDKWIDVGFWVLPDGTVSELEIVRRGSDSSWAEPLLDSIRGRRYSTAGEATYRLERYSYTAGYEHASATTGSHIRRRSPRARVEYLDLTTGEPRQPPSGDGGAP